MVRSDEQQEDRWPVPYSAMLTVGSAGALWILIIAGVRWLVA